MENIIQNNKVVTSIARIVADYYRVDWPKVCEVINQKGKKGKKNNIIFLLQITAFFADRLANCPKYITQEEIGSFLGGWKRLNVGHGIRRIEDILSVDKVFQSEITSIYKKLTSADIEVIPPMLPKPPVEKKVIQPLRPQPSVDVDDDIDKAVDTLSDILGVDPAIIRGRSRKKEIVFQRHKIAYVLHCEESFTVEKVGCGLGNRNHSTVLHSCGVIIEKSNKNRVLAEELRNITDELRIRLYEISPC